MAAPLARGADRVMILALELAGPEAEPSGVVMKAPQRSRLHGALPCLTAGWFFPVSWGSGLNGVITGDSAAGKGAVLALVRNGRGWSKGGEKWATQSTLGGRGCEMPVVFALILLLAPAFHPMVALMWSAAWVWRVRDVVWGPG